MVEEQFTIKVVMSGGSAGMRSYLEDRGFDIYRNSRISNRFEHVHGMKLDEEGHLDDGATFTAIWSGKKQHPDESAILRKVRNHPSVTQLKLYFERREYRRENDDIPG